MKKNKSGITKSFIKKLIDTESIRVIRTPYVIQEHLAKRAGKHCDLRIQRINGNVLESWALPRCRIPEKMGEKVLAIRTKPHSRLWLYFEGEIGEGYGKGTVKILQKGLANILNWGPHYLHFNIGGPKISGTFLLIRFKNEKDNWLLIRTKDKKMRL